MRRGRAGDRLVTARCAVRRTGAWRSPPSCSSRSQRSRPAWCSYQATRWNGAQTKQSGTTNRLRLEAGRAQGLAEAQTQVDLATFVQWVDAYALRRIELTDFYSRRFHKEFRPAFEAWLATRPLENPNAPLRPFALPQYRLAATAEAERLDAEAAASSALRDRDIQRQSNYVLGVVLFAVALFLAGVGTKLDSRGSGAGCSRAGTSCSSARSPG
ncbi:MAG TPA: hypothetical protein VFG93_00850 [Gaiellaceae bacterium]|nr:hypothetical protein [Gaiellaceae bacterium]